MLKMVGINFQYSCIRVGSNSHRFVHFSDNVSYARYAGRLTFPPIPLHIQRKKITNILINFIMAVSSEVLSNEPIIGS